jgi:ABC-type lipoprotein release transport system permease subunit
MLQVSLAIIAITFVFISALALRAPILLKMAFRNFRKRKKSSILAICGLLVSSAIISGSLAVGDSMENAVVQSAYANLGEVDEVVHSYRSFNSSVYDSLKADASLGQLTDALAPLIMLPVSVVSKASGLRETSTLIAHDNKLLEFGDLRSLDGSLIRSAPGSGEAFINSKLAEEIGIAQGQNITLTLRAPDFSIETIYSNKANLAEIELVVKATVENEGLGRFQLGAGASIPSNVFVNLSYIQGVLDMDSRINTILVSNRGGVEDGMALTEEVTQRLGDILDEETGYLDVGFITVALPDYVKVEHNDIFFHGKYLDTIQSIADSSGIVDAISPVTSYFVNTIENETESIYYSVVTGFEPLVDADFGLFTDNITGLGITGDIEDDEIIITNYVANRMGIGVGSPLTINYSVYDSAFRETFRFENFTVKYVVDIVGKADDEEIMPPFPGIKGTDSCADWDPPMDSFDRSLMDWEDLNYWQQYHGTPKAYITLDKAKALWTNDLGNLTTVKLKPSAGTNTTELVQHLNGQLNVSLGHKDAGISISKIKEDSVNSASGVQILTETFIAFGAVVIIAGMVLIAMLVSAMVEERRREIGTMRAVGSKRGQVARVFVFEGTLISSIASFIGTFAGIGIAYVCIYLTNAYWSNIVEGNLIALHFTYTTLVLGFAAGFLLALITYAIATYAASKLGIAESMREVRSLRPKAARLRAPIAVLVFGVLFLALYFAVDIGETLVLLLGLLGPFFIIIAVPFLLPSSFRGIGVGVCAVFSIIYVILYDILVGVGSSSQLILFFASGFAIIAACALAIAVNMEKLAAIDIWLLDKLRASSSVVKVALLNPIRRIGRTAMSIAMFAIVIFTLVALSANISGQQMNLEDAVKGQSGGYDVLGETSTSIRFDLGSQPAREKEGILGFPDDAEVVQFFTFGSPGGTCTNLNKDLPPRLIGTNLSFARDNELKFSSALDHSTDETGLIWSDLDVDRADGAIPAIGELNTIIWILQKDIGDTIEVTDEFGQRRQLVIVGITHNSIFPGSVFVSEDNIKKLYPTQAEYHLFLFRTQRAPHLVSYLENELSAYGMDARSTEDIVRENLAVEWSYMSLFQSLLVFGLFVGTAALAIRTTKAVTERRKEIGIMRALGYSRYSVMKIFLLENVYIALWGVGLGVIAGILISAVFFGPGASAGYLAVIPWLAIVFITLVVVVVSLVAAALPSVRAARMNPVDALRGE